MSEAGTSAARRQRIPFDVAVRDRIGINAADRVRNAAGTVGAGLRAGPADFSKHDDEFRGAD